MIRQWTEARAIRGTTVLGRGCITTRAPFTGSQILRNLNIDPSQLSKWHWGVLQPRHLWFILEWFIDSCIFDTATEHDRSGEDHIWCWMTMACAKVGAWLDRFWLSSHRRGSDMTHAVHRRSSPNNQKWPDKQPSFHFCLWLVITSTWLIQISSILTRSRFVSFCSWSWDDHKNNADH